MNIIQIAIRIDDTILQKAASAARGRSVDSCMWYLRGAAVTTITKITHSKRYRPVVGFVMSIFARHPQIFAANLAKFTIFTHFLDAIFNVQILRKKTAVTWPMTLRECRRRGHSARRKMCQLQCMPTCVAATQLSLARIREEQQKDELISCVIHQILSSEPITNALYKKYQGQLSLHNRILCRTWMDPIDGEECVPVIPTALQAEVTSSTHQNPGHANWETTWKSLKQRCFFHAIAKQCESCVQECQSCRVANPDRGVAPPAMRQDIPSMPWEVVQIDTLELGCQHGGRYHCVLVCVDMFTRWVEVLPLRRHNAVSVAEAFIEICTRFGPPRVIRCDNASEFRNHIVESLFHVFGVSASHGAVRHPQSQGGAERFNRTLLTLIRKAVDVGNDWEAELQMLLFFYCTRPHSVLGLSPMTAMFGWNARDLTIEPMDANDHIELDAWAAAVSDRAAN